MAFTRSTIRNLAKDSGVELPKELEDALVSEHLTARDAYAEEQVGLPRLIWSLAVSQSFDALIAFSGKPHQNSVEAALPSSEVSASRLHAFSEGYPLGKLMILE